MPVQKSPFQAGSQVRETTWGEICGFRVPKTHMISEPRRSARKPWRQVIPTFGTRSLCQISRADVQCFVAEKRKQGYSGSSIHSMRTALARVLQSAADWPYVEQNNARGIHVGNRDPKKERPYLSPDEVRKLVVVLDEPVRTLVVVSVLIGLRIGELTALRWNHVDAARSVIQVRETVSEGNFGTPKARSIRREIPISEPALSAFTMHRTGCRQVGSEDLTFASRNHMPLNPKNLSRRILRPVNVDTHATRSAKSANHSRLPKPCSGAPRMPPVATTWGEFVTRLASAGC
jgi:integrase